MFRSKANPRILVLSPIPHDPPYFGNRVRVARLLKTLEGFGARVFFHDLTASENGTDRTANWEMRWRRSLDTEELKKRVITLRDEIQPDIVVVEYALLADLLDLFPARTLKVIDTHDVFSNRGRAQARAGIEYPFATLSFSEEEEKRLLNKADLIVAIQSREAAYFSGLSSKSVIVIPHKEPVAPAEAPEGEPHLLFTGSRSHRNKCTVEQFLAHAFPRIAEEVPGTRLHIVGGVCELLDDSLTGVKWGIVPDFGEVFRKSRVALNPEFFGTGLSIKNITSLASGFPLVTTPIGSRGIESGADSAFVVAENWQELSERSVQLLKQAELRHSLRTAARDFARTIEAAHDDGVRHLLD